MNVSVIVPAHNEEENIFDVVTQIEKVLSGFDHELIVVNDHSVDKTKAIVLNLQKKYHNLVLVENMMPGSFANALRTGFQCAQTELIVPVMADLCDDLETVRKMYDVINSGYDIVCGARYISGGARIGGPKIKAFFSRFGGLSLHFLTGIPTFDVPNAFKMYRKKVLDTVEYKALGFEISMEITLKAHFAGFRVTEVPTVWKEREKGVSSFKTMKLLPKYLKVYVWALMQRITQLCQRFR